MLSSFLDIKGLVRLASKDYPEMILLWVMALLVLFLGSNFSVLMWGFFVLLAVGTFVLFVSRLFGKMATWCDLVSLILLSAAFVLMAKSAISVLCFVFLLLVRLTLVRADFRVKWGLVCIFALTFFSLMSQALDVPAYQLLPAHFELFSVCLLSLTLLAGLGHFWCVYFLMIWHKDQHAHSNQRLQTLVAIISRLTKFVPLQVWQPIVRHNKSVLVSNRRAKLTVMFSDIAGFTELSDTLSPDDLADILNTYMDKMTLIANRHGAVLDKFIGDGMLCFFGGSSEHSKGVKEDALACVAMAMDMRREMRNLNQQWRLMGFDGLHIRIGIATGYCHVGNFGSANRMSHTLIGREANLASRLESMANPDEILISQSTYGYICHDIRCELVGSYRLKGFENKVECWRVLDFNENSQKTSSWVDHHLPGFNLHLNFQDIRDYDYRVIKKHLHEALRQIDQQNA